ncbi:MAG: NAD-dependent epimerase/dehydratase family protein [Acidiferrobacter sp.]
MTRTVLITGANGFVGSHILAALRDVRDTRVIVACRDRTACRQALMA